MRRFYAPEQKMIIGRTYSIAGAEARHMIRVLRLAIGERIQLIDGSGLDHTAQIQQIRAERVEVLILESTKPDSPPSADITIAQALIKGRTMDAGVRQLTELGISRWVPFLCDRSVPTPNLQQESHRQERWRKIVHAAMKQCGRRRRMRVEALQDYREMLSSVKAHSIKLLFWENEPTALETVLASIPDKGRDVMALVGPEGGFTSKEVEMARASGFRCVGLGKRILRADTAGIAAAVLLQHFFGDLGRERA